LYSPVSTLFSASTIYFLGMYPGFVNGDPKPHNNWTIEEDLDRLEGDAIREHALLQEEWGDEEAGEAKLQRRALHVFAILAGSEPKGRDLLLETPASNMILLRKKEENEELLGSSKHIVEQFWPFHRAIIDIKKPKVVLVHGVACAKELAQALDLGKCETWSSGYGAQPQLYAWSLSANQRLLAIPNLGRYHPGGAREAKLKRFFDEAL
jgi:hypothetical protein